MNRYNLNTKGMAISTVLYSMMTLFLIMMIAVLTMMANSKQLMDKTKLEVLNELNNYKENSSGTGNVDIEAILKFLEPSGSIKAYGGETAPDGFLLCDGSAISRTTYAELFAVIGIKYGAGNGTTTFNIPNFKGRTIVGTDSTQTEFNVNGKTGGAKTHTLTIAEMPSHNHQLQMAQSGYLRQEEAGYSSGTSINNNTNYAVRYAGGSQPHNNLQPYQTANYIIRY